MDTKKQSRTAAGATKALADHKGFSLISNEKLLALYDGLRKLGPPGRTRNAGARSPFKSREAGAVAAAIDMQEGDRLAVLRQGAMLTVEPSLEGIVRFAPGVERGDSGAKTPAVRAKGKSPAGESAVERILGASLVRKAENKGRICVVLMHEGSDEEWAAALKIAAAHSLPLILVRQAGRDRAGAANGTAEGAARKKRNNAANAAAEPYLPFIPVDSNDVVAIYRVAFEAIDRARKGRGPTVIDCLPYLVQGGSTRKNPTSDPVVSMENYLAGKGLVSPKGRTKAGRKRLKEE